jgi:antitoxin component YwqK of YwqJK toxin-antitoxin module
LNFDTADIESMVFTNSDGTYPRVRYASAEIDNTGKIGNLAAGDAEFFNPNIPEMIYPIGNPYVSSISSPSYTTYQQLKGVAFNVSGSTLSAQISFTGSYAGVIKHLGNEGTTLSGDVVEQCYNIIVTDRQSNATITNGQVIPWTINGRNVALNNDGSVATFSTLTSDLTAFTATIIAKVFVVDGKKEGEYIKYYENGEINEIRQYVNNKLNGAFTAYFIDKQLLESCYYVDDKRHGEYKRYYDNGQLLAIYDYVNNKLHGEYTSYFINGAIFQLINYNYGTREGLHKKYNEDGDIKEFCYYANGEKID